MHDVMIIGGGPAGLFAAEELHKRGIRKVLIVDSGQEALARECPLTYNCSCSPCDILEGVGGSGGVSDGKLTFELDRGTQLEKIFDDEMHSPLLDQVENTFLKYGSEGVDYTPDPNENFVWDDQGTGLRFSTYRLRHVGSDGIQQFSHNFAAYIRSLDGIEFHSRSRALSLLWDGDHVVGATIRFTGEGSTNVQHVYAKKVIVAVGLWGVGWLEDQLTPHGIQYISGAAGFGMRIETPASVLKGLFDRFYDFKVMGEYNGMTLRSFCCNANGHIMPEYHKHLGVRNVNGHSYLDPALKSESSNFSLQAKVTPNLVPHTDPQSYVRSVGRAVNALSNGFQGRQPVLNFINRSDPQRTSDPTVTYPQARLVNIASALPDLLWSAFSEYLQDIDRIIPGIVERGWVYAPEIKYHAKKLPINRETWELEGARGVYILGDSTGLTGSYVSAALTGLIAASSIAKSLKEQ